MNEPRDPKLTLLGMPAFVPPCEEEPFPLTPYADVHVYTPSRSRPVPSGGRTPVMLPPPTYAARKQDPTLQLRAERYTPPSVESMCVAGAAVCWAVALLMLWLM